MNSYNPNGAQIPHTNFASNAKNILNVAQMVANNPMVGRYVDNITDKDPRLRMAKIAAREALKKPMIKQVASAAGDVALATISQQRHSYLPYPSPQSPYPPPQSPYPPPQSPYPPPQSPYPPPQSPYPPPQSPYPQPQPSYQQQHSYSPHSSHLPHQSPSQSQEYTHQNKFDYSDNNDNNNVDVDYHNNSFGASDMSYKNINDTAESALTSVQFIIFMSMMMLLTILFIIYKLHKRENVLDPLIVMAISTAIGASITCGLYVYNPLYSGVYVGFHLLMTVVGMVIVG